MGPLTPAVNAPAMAVDPVASRDTASASEGNISRDLPSVPETGPDPRGSGSTSSSVRRGSALAVMEGGASRPSTKGQDYVSSSPSQPPLPGARSSRERGRSFEMPLTGGSLSEGKPPEAVAEPSAEDVLLSRVEGSGRYEPLPSAAPPPSSQAIEGGYHSMGSVGFMSKRSTSAMGSSELYPKDGSVPQSRQTPLLSSAAADAAAAAAAITGSGNSRVDFSQLEPHVQRRTAGVLRMHVIGSVRGHIEAGHLDFINEIRPLTCLFIGFPSLLNVSDTATHQDQLGCVQFVVCQIQEVMRK